MCEWGNHVEVADLLAFNGMWHKRTWQIDACIADLVQVLSTGGVSTIGSCCGHNKTPGEILLLDGRRLQVLDALTVTPTPEEDSPTPPIL